MFFIFPEVCFFADKPVVHGSEILLQLVRFFFLQHDFHDLKLIFHIVSTRYEEAVEVTAWKQPDGTLTGVVINRTPETKPLCIRLNDQEATLLLPACSIADFSVRN